MGLGNCKFADITGNPSAGIPPNVSACMQSGPDINNLQKEPVAEAL
jgi:hypothetical protein